MTDIQFPPVRVGRPEILCRMLRDSWHAPSTHSRGGQTLLVGRLAPQTGNAQTKHRLAIVCEFCDSSLKKEEGSRASFSRAFELRDDRAQLSRPRRRGACGLRRATHQGGLPGTRAARHDRGRMAGTVRHGRAILDRERSARHEHPIR
jgi:hypothetical protein